MISPLKYLPTTPHANILPLTTTRVHYFGTIPLTNETTLSRHRNPTPHALPSRRPRHRNRTLNPYNPKSILRPTLSSRKRQTRRCTHTPHRSNRQLRCIRMKRRRRSTPRRRTRSHRQPRLSSRRRNPRRPSIRQSRNP